LYIAFLFVVAIPSEDDDDDCDRDDEDGGDGFGSVGGLCGVVSFAGFSGVIGHGGDPMTDSGGEDNGEEPRSCVSWSGMLDCAECWLLTFCAHDSRLRTAFWSSCVLLAVERHISNLFSVVTSKEELTAVLKKKETVLQGEAGGKKKGERGIWQKKEEIRVEQWIDACCCCGAKTLWTNNKKSGNSLILGHGNVMIVRVRNTATSVQARAI
jgi:hypothetical protein